MDYKVFGDLALTSELVERRLDLWNTLHKARRERKEKAPDTSYRFITIARDEGCLGNEIAQELSSRLKWRVFDNEIVSRIAMNNDVRESLVSQLDEKSLGLVQDMILRFLEIPECRSFGSADYHKALLETLIGLAKQGDAILVGRGASFALRTESLGLNLRITASLGIRARRLSEVWKVSSEEARNRIRIGDEERRRFIRQHYRQNFEDIRFYDLVFNTDRASPECVASAIIGYMNLSSQ